MSAANEARSPDCALRGIVPSRPYIDERPLPRGQGRGRVDVDDAFAALLELEGGCLATLEATRFALGRKNHQVFEVNGSLGSLSFDLERLNELKVHWAAGGPGGTGGWTEVLVTEPSHPFIASWWPPGHILGWEHTFVHEIAHLLDAIANGREVGPLGATFEDGYRNAVICDAIVESAAAGRRVEIS
ncbi:MAG TPA: Gfo/Idh/MocA family oxidoreductase [Candidatus Dormibacteraeota bacterium]